MKVLSPKDVSKCRRFHHIVPSSETVSWRIQQDIGDVGNHAEQHGEQKFLRFFSINSSIWV